MANINLVDFKKPQRYYGKGDAIYFMEVMSTMDSDEGIEDIVNGDEAPHIYKEKVLRALTKKQLVYDRIRALKQLITIPAFSLLESAMLARVKFIETRGIWSAKEKGDQVLERKLECEHEGIMRFFDAFNSVSDKLETVGAELKEIQKYVDKIRPADEEDPRTELHENL